jgi:hypothetical protein
MENDTFIQHYLRPSSDNLDRQFTRPLPEIPGLEKCGEFIVQSEHENTFSTNIISKFENTSTGVRLVEVYKNTENRKQGTFVRLVGTISLVKRGYPFLFLDGAVSNVNFQNSQQCELMTRAAIHFPQADTRGRNIFFENLGKQADGACLTYSIVTIESLPDFWGPLWRFMTAGVDLDAIQKLRNFAWNAYQSLYSQTEEKSDFDYRPVQHHMIFNNAQAEHLMFKKVGLSVPAEVQAAFFSVLVTGV